LLAEVAEHGYAAYLAAKPRLRAEPLGDAVAELRAGWDLHVEFGLAKAESRDLLQATNAWLKVAAQGNPELRVNGPQQALQISQRSALRTPLVNPSPLGGQERIAVYTTFLADGSLFYYLTVVPEKDAQMFQETFQRIVDSIRLTDR